MPPGPSAAHRPTWWVRTSTGCRGSSSEGRSVTGSVGPFAHPYHEYGGLTSIPGPFHCSEARIVMTALQADPERLDSLCATVLVEPDGTSRYTPVGEFVMLSFGSMVVRSTNPDRSGFFDTPYSDMGAAVERHVALWVPTVAHRGDG